MKKTLLIILAGSTLALKSGTATAQEKMIYQKTVSFKERCSFKG